MCGGKFFNKNVIYPNIVSKIGFLLHLEKFYFTTHIIYYPLSQIKFNVSILIICVIITYSLYTLYIILCIQNYIYFNNYIENYFDRFKVTVGTWNVGTLTGRNRELAEVLKRRNVNICCVQETKWKGERVREIGEGYKIIYSGRPSTRNRVGVILDEEMKGKVVEVIRKSDKVNFRRQL